MEEGAEYLVPSRDGTPIAVWRRGSGPPLLLVHGMVADHSTTWRQVLPELAERFTVHAMDRRGRGGSGDGSGYDLQREAEDVASVVDAIGEPVHVVGHSYGGLVAAEAALLSSNVERLVLYEGMILEGTDVVPPGLAARLQEMLDAGQLEGTLLHFLRDFVGMSETEIDLLRSGEEAWKIRIGNARTIPRELEAQERYVFPPRRFESMTAPTLLLVGSESPRREMEAAEAVAAELPDARISVMAGQEHIAMYTAPEVFIAELVDFAGAISPPTHEF
jgi:pimeloyl-ACP methyl ester carboxylesterase